MDIDPGDIVEAVADVAEAAFDVSPRRREESGCLSLFAALIGIAAIVAMIVYAVYVIVAP